MSMSVGECADYLELLIGKAGVNRDEIDRELIYRILNSKAVEFIGRTNSLDNDATLFTKNGTLEYELPPDALNVFMVELDGEKIDKIRLEKAVELQER